MTRNDLLATAGETLVYAEDYVDTRIELVKLGVAEKGSKLAADAIAGLIVATLGIFALACLTIALAIWLGWLVGSYALGFVLVGVLYLAVGAVLFALRERLLATPILQSLIASLFKPEDPNPAHHGRR